MMADLNDISGLAALSICESLLLALNEHGVLTEGQIITLLSRAARAVPCPTDQGPVPLPRILQRTDTWPMKSPVIRGQLTESPTTVRPRPIRRKV